MDTWMYTAHGHPLSHVRTWWLFMGDGTTKQEMNTMEKNIQAATYTSGSRPVGFNRIVFDFAKAVQGVQLISYMVVSNEN